MGKLFEKFQNIWNILGGIFAAVACSILCYKEIENQGRFFVIAIFAIMVLLGLLLTFFSIKEFKENKENERDARL